MCYPTSGCGLIAKLEQPKSDFPSFGGLKRAKYPVLFVRENAETIYMILCVSHCSIRLRATVPDHQCGSVKQVLWSPVEAVQFILHSGSLVWHLAVINLLEQRCTMNASCPP